MEKKFAKKYRADPCYNYNASKAASSRSAQTGPSIAESANNNNSSKSGDSGACGSGWCRSDSRSETNKCGLEHEAMHKCGIEHARSYDEYERDVVRFFTDETYTGESKLKIKNFADNDQGDISRHEKNSFYQRFGINHETKEIEWASRIDWAKPHWGTHVRGKIINPGDMMLALYLDKPEGSSACIPDGLTLTGSIIKPHRGNSAQYGVLGRYRNNFNSSCFGLFDYHLTADILSDTTSPKPHWVTGTAVVQTCGLFLGISPQLSLRKMDLSGLRAKIGYRRGAFQTCVSTDDNFKHAQLYLIYKRSENTTVGLAGRTHTNLSTARYRFALCGEHQINDTLSVKGKLALDKELSAFIGGRIRPCKGWWSIHGGLSVPLLNPVQMPSVGCGLTFEQPNFPNYRWI